MKAIKMFSAGFLRGARVFDNYSEASCRLQSEIRLGQLERDTLVSMTPKRIGILFLTTGILLFFSAIVGKQPTFYAVGAVFVIIGAVYLGKTQKK